MLSFAAVNLLLTKKSVAVGQLVPRPNKIWGDRMSKYWVAPLIVALTPFAAHAAEVTPGNLQGWKSANLAGGGTAVINGTYTPPGAGQNGSLQLKTPANSGKADFAYSLAGKNVTLADIANGAISFDYYRSSTSTVAGHFLPALRFSFTNAEGKSGLLIWEGVYNSVGTVTTDSWQTATLTGDYFYQRTANYIGSFPTGGTTDAQVYDKSLASYLDGSVYTGSTGRKTYALGAGTVINGLEIGIGSGWGGAFDGAVDNVSIDLGTKGQISANFQVKAAAAVPEPATWAMMVLGFGVMGIALRRKTALRFV